MDFLSRRTTKSLRQSQYIATGIPKLQYSCSWDEPKLTRASLESLTETMALIYNTLFLESSEYINSSSIRFEQSPAIGKANDE